MFAILLVSSVFVFGFGQEQDWSYHGERGPSEWPRLFPEYCSYSNQSPINIDHSFTTYDPYLEAIVFEGYNKTLSNSRIVNTGHTVEISPNSNDLYCIRDGGLLNTFCLNNIHFHWGNSTNYQGSEHAINGYKYPIEAHFVHKNEKYGTIEEALKYRDGLAVLAQFFKISYFNNLAIQSITEALSDIRYAGNNRTFELGSPVSSLLPSIGRQQFYRYNGSLTTPNCNEAVIWTVFNTPLEITDQQLGEFFKLYATEEGSDEEYLVDTFRPIQPVNNRSIRRSADFP